MSKPEPAAPTAQQLRQEYTIQLSHRLSDLKRQVGSVNAEKNNFSELLQALTVKVDAAVQSVQEVRSDLEATNAQTAEGIRAVRADLENRIIQVEKGQVSWERMATWSLKKEQELNDPVRWKAGEYEHRLEARDAVADDISGWEQRIQHEKRSWDERYERERSAWTAQRQRDYLGYYLCEWRELEADCGHVFADRDVSHFQSSFPCSMLTYIFKALREHVRLAHML